MIPFILVLAVIWALLGVFVMAMLLYEPYIPYGDDNGHLWFESET